MSDTFEFGRGEPSLSTWKRTLHEKVPLFPREKIWISYFSLGNNTVFHETLFWVAHVIQLPDRPRYSVCR